MISNICRANFNGGRTAHGNNRFQWDYGQILEISGIENLPDPFTAQFSNYPVLGTAKTAVGTGGSVEIPNEYFVSGQNIYCFIVLHTDEDDGRTVYIATIPVTKRPKPIDDPITPTQQSTIDTAIAALQAGVARAEGYAEAAEEQAGIAQSAATTATEAATRAEGAVADVEAAATRAEQAADGAAASATAASGSASDSAASATAAEGFAGNASTSAGNAAQSATQASQSATAASGSATSAAGSATAAAGSATTAGNKATEAAGSATAAAGSATTAGVSATAAQAAQTAAEAAQTAAETAQGAAEDAAESVSASAAQIAQNTADISLVKSAFDSVFVTTKRKNLFDKSTVLENKYCNVNGVISDYNGRYVTDYIPVEAGKIVTSSYLNSATQVQTQATYSSLCCYDSTKAVVSGGNINQQTFTVPDGVAFVRITFASNMYVYDGMVELTDDGVPSAYEPYVEDSVSLSEDITIQMDQVIGLESRLTADENSVASIKSDLDGILDTDIVFDQSGFIRYDGALIANSNYISTDFVDVAVNGTFVKYKYRLRMFANTKIAYYNDSKVFISAISPSESSTVEYVEGEVPYVDGAKYVRFCTASGITDYYVKYATVKNAVIGGTNDSNPCNYTGNDMSVFNKVLCIGDSLTSGTFNYRVGGTTGNYIEDAKYSYPTYLKKLTGCDTVNMGNGGMSSAEWYNTHQNDDLSGYDCAVIQLGVNDCIRYTTWGSTSETAFTNIINKLKTENKNIKIFVANIIPATSYSNAQYLAFSADLLAWVTSTYANDASVIPLDMQQYGHTKDSPAYNCGHLSAYGYWRLAQDYKGYIGWYMNQNKTVFKEVQFIGTEYYYDPIT